MRDWKQNIRQAKNKTNSFAVIAYYKKLSVNYGRYCNMEHPETS